MTMITPSYLGETIEYSSLHACRSTLEDPTSRTWIKKPLNSLPRRQFSGAMLFLDSQLAAALTKLVLKNVKAVDKVPHMPAPGCRIPGRRCG